MQSININRKYHSYEEPNICPHCHVTNEPHLQIAYETNNDNELLTIWKCSNKKCYSLFIAEYKRWDASIFKISRFLNGLPKGPDWPKPIIELKSGKLDNDGNQIQSNFIKTYLQSLEAENCGLDELAGMGYRKAIEYLVKDWAIQNNPDEIAKIENSWLGATIKGYYEGDLKDILERATWLGNDQAHYNKLFEEFNIDILKELIDLIMVELDRQYKKAHYIELIQSRK